MLNTIKYHIDLLILWIWSRKNNYCRYDSGKKTIGIYQYNDIVKNESYGKLSKEISAELEKIYSMTKNNINVQNFLNEKEK